jgi:hypothetical protein
VSDLPELRDRLVRVREAANAQWQLVLQKRSETAEFEKVHKRMAGQAEALAKYIHELDGQERDCPGHEFISGPSGRGIGFDSKCRHCGYFQTLYPVY